MTKQDIWDSIITPQAKARMKRMSLAEQLAKARAQASLRHDQSDIQDAFSGDIPDESIPKLATQEQHDLFVNAVLEFHKQ